MGEKIIEDLIKSDAPLNDWSELMHMSQHELERKDQNGALALKQKRLVLKLRQEEFNKSLRKDNERS